MMQIDNYIKSIQIQSVGAYTASVNDLRYLIDNSERLRMVVAFWTINPEVISSNLSTLLGKSESFACIDIHQPTNIDKICALAENGANLFFSGKSINEKRKPDGPTPKLSTNLMHSKILLFDINDEESELWIGSHNWTEYSLGGINIETSVRIVLGRESQLYRDSEKLLENIKRECSKVDPLLREVYKSIQEPEQKVTSIAFLARDSFVNDKSIIHIFGTNTDDYNRSLLTIDSKIYVTIQGDEGKELLFQSRVLKSGYLPKSGNDVGWTELEEGYWVLYHGNEKAQFLENKSIPPKEFLIDRALFVVTLVLYEKCPEYMRLDPPSELVPVVPVAGQERFENWTANRGWVHPDRVKAPVIVDIPFDHLDDYRASGNQRALAIYGNSQYDSTMREPYEDMSRRPNGCVNHIQLEYVERNPLVRKLVLKGAR